jgi:hypothetical protein
MSDGNYHITGSEDAGWDVKRAGAERASAHFDRCKDAVKRGREMAGRNGVRLILHGEDGQILSNEAPPEPSAGSTLGRVATAPKMVLNRIGSAFKRD